MSKEISNDSSPTISIIAAVGANLEIGKDQKLLWHLPLDFKFFKEQTKGKAVVMGRKTFESIGRALPDRLNIVVSRSGFSHEGVITATSLTDAIDAAGKLNSEIMIIGGSTLYNQALDAADTLYLTHVESCFPDADTFFPQIDDSIWVRASLEKHYADDKHKHNYTFTIYKKINMGHD